MKQKTYHIQGYTQEKISSAADEISGLREYAESAQILILLLEQCWDAEKIAETTALLQKKLPKAEIVGVNHFDTFDINEMANENVVITVMFFEHPAFSVERVEMSGMTDTQAGKALNAALCR